jgi:hypothetical protein
MEEEAAINLYHKILAKAREAGDITTEELFK